MHTQEGLGKQGPVSAPMDPQSCFLSGVWGRPWGSAHCGFRRWRGDYGGKKQLWFPSNYVEEMVSPAALEPEREVRPGPYWWEGIPVSTAHTASTCLRVHSTPVCAPITTCRPQSDEHGPHACGFVFVCRVYFSRALRRPLMCTQQTC